MNGDKLILSGNKLRKNRARAGFGIAPILYMLGLIGVGAGVLFSSYSQSIKNNINMTNSVTVKNDLDSAATTLAATSVLSADGTLLCPPQGGSASAECVSAPTDLVDLASVVSTDPHLPSNVAFAGAGGSQTEVGVFTPGAGTKQLDPWGHYYIVCRWENSPTNTSTPAFQIISAGPGGAINTQCGSATAAAGNYTTGMNAANAINRASVWQVGTETGTSTLKASYGASGVSVDSTGNLTVPGNIEVTGSYTSPLGSITLTGGGLTSATGAFTGALTAENSNFQVGAGGAILAANGGFNVASGGTLSAAAGAFTIATGGAVSAASGAFGVDSTGTLTIGPSGSPAFTVASATGNTSISGTLAAIGSVTIGTAGSTTTPSLTTYGQVNIATTVSSSTTPLPYLSVGSSLGGTPPVYPFYVTQAGGVVASEVTAGSFNGTLNGNVNGGTVSASSITDSGALSVTGAATIPNISGSTTVTGNLTVTGTINGSMTIGTGGVTLTGVLPIINGGTSASTASQALINLGGNNASNLTMGTLAYTRMDTTNITDTGGPYNEVFVDAYGRVTSAQWVAASPGITDGSGDSVNVGAGNVTITINSAVQGYWDSTGLMIGSSLSPKNKLDVYGATAIGVGYAGVDTAPANGLIVVGSVGIGTSSPASALQVVGTVTAGTFSGSGAGLTNIGTTAITGTLGPGNGGTGTSTTFTQGSVVFVGSSGVYSQDNAEFFWNDTSHYLGIGTSSPSQMLSVGNSNQFTVSSAGALSAQTATIGASGITPIVVTGGTGGGANANGTYYYAGQYAGKNEYQNTNNWDIWWNSSGFWMLTPASNLGVATVSYYYVGSAGTTPTLGSSWTTGSSVSGTITLANASTSVLTVDGGGDITTGGVLALTGTGNSYIIGAVGVGTTSPGAQLDVETSTQTTDVYGNNSKAAGIGVYGNSSGTGVTYGVEGTASSATGYGGYFSNSGSGFGLGVATGGIFIGSSTTGPTGSGSYGLYNNGGTLYWNGNAIATEGSGGEVTGSGTLNYIPKWTPSGSQLGNSLLFDNGTNVGIGTNTPTYLLSLSGAAAQTFWMERSAAASDVAGNNLTVQAGGASLGSSNLAGGNLILASGISTGTGSSQIQFNTYPATTSGTSDNTALAAATLSATGTLAAGTVNTTLQGTGATVGSSNLNGGNLTLASGISTGTGTSNINFNVYPGVATGATQNTATTAMTILGGGNVGINTPTPQQLFHVAYGASTTSNVNEGCCGGHSNSELNVTADESFGYLKLFGFGYFNSGTQDAFFTGGHCNGSNNTFCLDMGGGTGTQGYTAIGASSTTMTIGGWSGNYGSPTNFTNILFENSGDVAIGTTAPGAQLDVETSTVTTDIYGNNSKAAGIGVYGNSSGTGVTYGVEGTASSATGYGGYFSNSGSGFGLGVATGGIYIASSTSGPTSNGLYNNSGTLYWNGNIVSTGGGTVGTGAQYQMAYYSAANTVTGLANITTDASGDLNILPTAAASGTTPKITLTVPADTGLTASTNAIIENWNSSSATRTHATGALTLQSDFIINGSTDAFAAASTLTNGATLDLGYKGCGTNGTCTNESALYIPTQALTGTTQTTNSYGINVTAATGATNNYAAIFNGGNVGIGTTAPSQSLSVGASNQFTVSSSGALTAQSAIVGSVSVAPIIVSGSGSPSPNGTYTYAGQYNGYNYYQLGTSYYIWHVSGSGDWFLSATLGSNATSWAHNSNASPPLFTFTGFIGVSGSATSSAGVAADVVVDGGGDLTLGGVLTDNGTGNSSFAGSVGIGTTSPAAQLDVETSTQTTDVYGNSSTAAGIGVYGNSSGTGVTYGVEGTASSGTGYGGYFSNSGSGFGLGVATGGIYLGSSTSGPTSYGLYNNAGTLYWNGNAIASGSGGWTGLTITVPEGGTGDTTLTQYGVLLGAGASAVNVSNVGTTGTVFEGVTGSNPAFNANLIYNGTESNPFGTDYTTTGPQPDVILGTSSSVRYNGGATATFYGIAAPATAGQVIRLHNASNFALTLSNQSASDTTAANRIITGTGADLAIPSNTSVTMQYDSTAARWRVTGSSNAAVVAWPLLGPADTAAAPDYSWAAQSGTGLYYNTGIGFTVSGSSAGTWTSTGLGIGTASPGSTLQVNGNAAIGYATNTAGPASGLAVSGPVTIGTTSQANGGALIVQGSMDFVNGAGSITTYSGGSGLSLSGDLYATAGYDVSAGEYNTRPVTTNASNSGVFNVTTRSPGFNPASGTATFNMLEISPIIDQTATATGVTTGLNFSDTITSAYDYRQVEVPAYTDNLLGTPPATRRTVHLGQATYAAGSAETVTTASTLDIVGAPIAGSNVSITNSYGLLVEGTTSVASGVTNAYGLSVSAPTGATNNYAAAFSGTVGVGTTSPAAQLDVETSTVTTDIYGNNTNAAGIGVYGNSSGTGVTYGVEGTASSATGYGGYFSNSGSGFGLGVATGGIFIGSSTTGPTGSGSYGLYNNGGTLYWNGNAIATEGSGGEVTGSGTLNYIPKWTPSGSQLGNSLLFDNGTNVGIGTNTPTYLLSLSGAAAQTFWMERSAAASDVAGNNLTVQAGGASLGSSNLAGGNLILASGISTGTGSSQIQFNTYPATTSGTSDNTALAAATLSATGTLAAGTVNTTLQGTGATVGSSNLNGGNLTLASGISTGTGTSNINFNVYPGVATGATQNTATTAMTISGAGIVNISVAPATGSYQGSLQLNGSNGIWQDVTNTNLAVGATAFPTKVSQSGGGNNGKANTAVGNGALNANTTGDFNVAVGGGSLSSNTTGGENTAVGVNSMAWFSGGTSSSAFGYGAASHGSGSSNSAFGAAALALNSTGGYNSAFGAAALTNDSTGTGNSAFGGGIYSSTKGTGSSITTGSNNAIFGSLVASTTLTTGSNNILIGTDASTDVGSSSTSNSLNIGNTIYATNMNNSTNTSGVGHVGIGTASPAALLDVYTSAGIGAIDLGGVNGISYPSSDSGGGSIAIGSSALSGQTSSAAYDNIAIGYQAMGTGVVTGTSNTAIGYEAAQNLSSAYYITAVGYEAGQTGMGTESVAVGMQAGQSNMGSSSVAVGYVAGSGMGASSVAIGRQAGYVAMGSNSVAIGAFAGDQYMGANSVAVGTLAGEYGKGANSVAVGYESLSNSSMTNAATDNTALGYSSGAGVTTGSGNLILGYNVASAGGATGLTTGSSNILIGTSNAVDTPANGTSNYLDIGNIIFATGMTGTVSSPAGLVGIGSNTPQARLDVEAGTSTTNIYGNNTNAAGIGVYGNSSGTGVTYGVEGTASSATGYGGYFSNSGSGFGLGVATGGIYIAPSTSGPTTYGLYNSGGTLYWNGNALAMAGVGATGSQYQMAYFNPANTVTGDANITTDATGDFNILPTAAASGTTPKITLTVPADTGLTASTNAIIGNLNSSSATRTHATGALTLQSDFIINGSTDAFAAASTLTNGATLDLGYKGCGTNGTCTNESALYIPTQSLTGTTQTTNSYGINVTAATGATNNYAAIFNGGNVGIGTTAPVSALTVGNGTPTTAANGINFGSDTTADLYRSAAGVITTDGSFTAGGVTAGGYSAPYSINMYGGRNSANPEMVLQNIVDQSYAAGTGELFLIGTGSHAFDPSSGTGIWNELEVAGTVNQTSTATGISRGTYLDPTLTSAYDFRALETLGYTDNVMSGSPAARQQVLFNAPTLAAAASKTITNAATQVISGAPIAGSNISITNSYGLLINGATSVAAGVTNAYGLYVNVPSGATNNYGAVFASGNVGIGSTSPQATLDVNGYAKLKLNASAPTTCSATTQGSFALTHTARSCICDATNTWSDTVTGSACSW